MNYPDNHFSKKSQFNESGLLKDYKQPGSIYNSKTKKDVIDITHDQQINLPRFCLKQEKKFTLQQNYQNNFNIGNYPNLSSFNSSESVYAPLENKNKKYVYIKNVNPSYFQKGQGDDLSQTHIKSNQESRYEAIAVENHQLLLKSRDKSLSELNSGEFATKDEQIIYLQQNLNQERQKLEDLKQQTIKNQLKILETISELQFKLNQIKTQNLSLNQENCQLKHTISKLSYHPNSLHSNKQTHYPQFQHQLNLELKQEIEALKDALTRKSTEFNHLQSELKKVKGVANGLIDMMKKVDLLQAPSGQDELKYAWKWIKKVVWEYEAIRKKAFSWKKAYDQLNNYSQNEGSVSSQQYY